LIWNLVVFGSFNQISGSAYPYYLHTLWQTENHSFAELLAHEARLAYGIVANLARFSGFGKGIVLLATGVGWLVYEACVRRKAWIRHDERLVLTGLLWITGGSLTLLLFHGLVRWMYLPWYFVPTSMLLALWFGLLLSWVATRSFALVLLLGGTYIVFQVVHGMSLWSQGGMWASQREAIEEQMPEYQAVCEDYDTIGITDAGYAGYYLPCRVINLDGVVNNEVFAAIVQGQFRQYLDRREIKYVALNSIVKEVVEKREGIIPQRAPFTP